MRDFTKRYNTVLSPEQEAIFQAWAIDESKAQGRNVLNDLYDYDLRGMWDAGAGFGGGNGHAADTFKKPLKCLKNTRESIGLVYSQMAELSQNY